MRRSRRCLIIFTVAVWHMTAGVVLAGPVSGADQTSISRADDGFSGVITALTTLMSRSSMSRSGAGVAAHPIGEAAKPVTPPDRQSPFDGVGAVGMAGFPINLEAVPQAALMILNPSLVTASASGGPMLAPEARRLISRMIAEARANPAGFKARYAPLASEMMAGNVPPEFSRYLNPSLMETSPSGARTLTPMARGMLWQVVTMARGNRTAMKESLKGLIGMLSGAR